MNKLARRYPILFRILIVVGVIACIIGIIVLIVVKLNDSNALNYDLGEKGNDKNYNDIIIKSYNEYKEVVKDYDIDSDLGPQDFENNYYLVSFQEYDECSEAKRKQVGNVTINDNIIDVEFKRFNKCGWCKSHIILYLIKIDKLDKIQGAKINYTYTDDKTINCGNALG